MTFKEALDKKLITQDNLASLRIVWRKQDYFLSRDTNNDGIVNIQIPYGKGTYGVTSRHWDDLPEFFGKKKLVVETK